MCRGETKSEHLLSISNSRAYAPRERLLREQPVKFLLTATRESPRTTKTRHNQ